MKIVAPGNTFPFAEFTIAMGFFLLLTIEQIIADVRERNFALSRSDALPVLAESSDIVEDTPSEIVNHDQNATIRALAMTIALTIHSTFEGIAIGVQNTIEAVLQV
jgi:zinc transporter ZupT